MSDRAVCKDNALIARAQNAVEDFHLKFGQSCPFAPPQFPTPEVAELRVRLMAEEMLELTNAIMTRDMVGIADGMADLLYVVLGTAVTYGIDLEPIFQAVHAANMAKEGGGKRADGKVRKPKGWTPPDVGFLLRKQGYQSDSQTSPVKEPRNCTCGAVDILECIC
jgi:predicted HAD superfamily Cof-like phosphohydrolase